MDEKIQTLLQMRHLFSAELSLFKFVSKKTQTEQELTDNQQSLVKRQVDHD
jgi:hypothetical protein